ncbi:MULTISPECIES: L,D-transpeptidase [unclassified Frankia]|uniref:L,D-transpeptidase n=1 Tax=unclassified Frankia TaxID=2632575 RepID=UPI0027DBD70D|nr:MULTISPECIES: L,D-transpeptidase [unclassified Frankia]
MTVAAGVTVAVALAGCGGGHPPVAGPKPSVSASPTRPVAKPRVAGLDPAHLPAGWSLVAWPAAGTVPVFGQSAPATAADAPTTQAPAVAPVGRSADQPTSTLANPNAEGAPLALLVKRYQPDWLQVSLPVRPNGTTGWIRTKDTRLTATPFSLTVDKTRHELTVFKDGKPTGVYPVGIGTGTTPTPLGHFYLAELLKPANPAGPWGPYAFGLSGFSDVITNFDGGDGIIGLHGTNQPDRVGTDVSMGCIRLRNSDITALAALLPVGTPVTIT